MEEKNGKKFLVFKETAFEPASANYHNPKQDTCHWQSICYQATLRFNISLMVVFPKQGSLRVMKNMMKVLSCTYWKSLGPFNMLTVKGCSETVVFRERSNQVFDSL